MVSVVKSFGIYTEGITRVTVAEKFTMDAHGVESSETQPVVSYPKYVEFQIELDAIPGLVNALEELHRRLK